MLHKGRRAAAGSSVDLTISTGPFASTGYVDNTGASFTLTSGFQTGDLCVVGEEAYKGGGPTPSDTTPSGWTTVAMATSSTSRTKVIAKSLTASDDSTSHTSISGGTATRRRWIILRPSVVIGSWTYSATSNIETTAGDPASITASHGGNSAMDVAVAFALGGSMSLTTASPTPDIFVDGSGNNMGVWYLSSSTSLTWDAPDSGVRTAVSLHSFYMA